MLIDCFNNNTLTFLIFIPFVVAILVLLTYKQSSNLLSNILFVISAILTVIISLYLYINFNPDGSVNYLYKLAILPNYGINYIVGLSSVSLLLVMIIAFIIPILYLFLGGNRGFLATLLFSQSAFFSVVCAQDLLFFYAGWEIMLIPIFVMIGVYSSSKDVAMPSSIKMMYYTMAGSLIMLFSIIYVGVMYYEQFGAYSFALSDLENINFTKTSEIVLFLMFMFALAIKIPLFPLHMWMRDAYVNSHSGATILLSAVASKVAVFAMVIFLMTVFRDAYVELSTIFVIIGIFSMLYFGVTAVMQRNIKGAFAYSSASHLGLIVAGVFALNKIALTGSLFQIVMHSLVSTMIFLVGYHIIKQFKTKEMSSFFNVAKNAPMLTAFFTIGLLCSVGLPSTGGFIGELLMIIGIFKFNYVAGFFATFSVVIGAIYMFKVLKNAMFKSDKSVDTKFSDINFRQGVALFILSIFIFWFGLYPKVLTNNIKPSVAVMVQKVNDMDSNFTGSDDSASMSSGMNSNNTESNDDNSDVESSNDVENSDANSNDSSSSSNSTMDNFFKDTNNRTSVKGGE